MSFRPRAPGVEDRRPSPGRALIIFLRPSTFGGAVQAAIWRDGPEFLGTSSSGTFIAVELDPGTHTFMVQSETADFIQAEVDADKTYFATVRARMGMWKARFSFGLMEPESERWDNLSKWLADCREATINDHGHHWATEHEANAAKLWAKVKPKWDAKENRPIIQADWGK